MSSPSAGNFHSYSKIWLTTQPRPRIIFCKITSLFRTCLCTQYRESPSLCRDDSIAARVVRSSWCLGGGSPWEVDVREPCPCVLLCFSPFSLPFFSALAASCSFRDLSSLTWG